MGALIKGFVGAGAAIALVALTYTPTAAADGRVATHTAPVQFTYDIAVGEPNPYGYHRHHHEGHYVRRLVLVEPGHYETYRVWYPPVISHHGHVRVPGHYEVHHRWVPDRYEYRTIRIW